jgi:photosystem II stability/assembly factor-like uncharacterized protein
MRKLILLAVVLCLTIQLISIAKEKPKEKDTTDLMKSGTFSGLKFRSIGPGIASGRIIDIAVSPNDFATWYVAVACGSVWKTTNAGIKFSPIFDGQPSFSIGCVTIDPNNPHTVWVGTGENNSQRSVSYGDGVYKSVDDGKSWQNMGLKKSEHIGKIIIDPRNSDVIYVAAQGPLWGPGGERGLYKSTDGGKTWEKSLEVSENTGITDVCIDSRNPDIMYAASYQRRRHVWTLINGGPESAIYKSVDAGKTWRKLTNGLPGGYVGRIGIAISPMNPDVLYALIELPENSGGFYRSSDRGESWEKRSAHAVGSAQYYQELFCDPVQFDKVYTVETVSQFTEDGGKTFKNLGLKDRHVDDHALWIDPKNTKHIIIGGDGGLYETYDNTETWRFFENIPVTQFYRICVDNAEPFYNVYGGTQDNSTIGGPVRTISSNGLMNQDFFFTKEGDGFQSRVDPQDPDIVYSQAQYGSIVRFDKKSGQRTDIQPIAEKGEELRWNWDSPLIISPHSHTRLYFAANRLFRSDDRGDSWKVISPDLSKQIDRNQLKVMDKIWDAEAVAKNASTSLFGNIVALCESPKKENLIYVGTDDGLIQVTEDGGKNWQKIDNIPGIPDMTYVSDIFASQFDENVVYATFDNHKMADFKPYIMKSNDKGKTWQSISGNMPENGAVYSIYEDFVNPDLLFAGTEFGIFFTADGGKKWVQLKGGLPSIAIKDIEIQKREGDLALASFGRGFYILDDYSPLREVKPELFDKKAYIFPIKDALMYIQDPSHGRRNLGESFFRAENPYGAVFTYYLKDDVKTKKDIRKEKEKKLTDEGKTPPYPTKDELKEEDLEEAPYLVFVISDMNGNPIRKLTAPAKSGISRLTWDMRYHDLSPVSENIQVNSSEGYPVVPGDYIVSMSLFHDGKFSELSAPVKFTCKALKNETLPAPDRKVLADFQEKMQFLAAALYGANNYIGDLDKRIKSIKNALYIAQGNSYKVIEKMKEIEARLNEVKVTLRGDESLGKRNENQTPPILERLDRIVGYMWANNSAPSPTSLENYKIIGDAFEPMLAKLKQIAETDIPAIEKQMDAAKAPWTPGRFPEWKMK